MLQKCYITIIAYFLRAAIMINGIGICEEETTKIYSKYLAVTMTSNARYTTLVIDTIVILMPSPLPQCMRIFIFNEHHQVLHFISIGS